MRFLGLSLAVCMVSCECKDKDSSMEYPRLIEVENSVVLDSVHATFKLRNKSSEPIKLILIPECDCTGVYPEQLILKPHSGKKVNISFQVNTSGTYEKIVFLQREDVEEPDTVVIKGYAEK
jgi:hypothetical protein